MKSTIPELVAQFISGDQSAYAELVRHYQRRIYAVAYRLVGNHLDADEVVQETFVRVYHRRTELSEVSNFSAFLVRIATNYSIDLLRKRRGHGSLSEETGSLSGEVQIELSRKVMTPGESYQNKVVMQEILKALEKLPPRQRMTAILHDIEGYTKAEVAQIMECPEATVRSNLHIARTKLKKLLQKRLFAKE